MKATITVYFVLSIIGLNSSFRRHFFVTEQMTWKNAQAYCRKYHDDISTVTKEEAQLLSRYTDATYSFNWIGLYENPNDPGVWMWSGGERISYDNWDNDQPNSYSENCVALKQNTSKLHDATCSGTLTFYCMEVFGAILVDQNKTWDEAMDYCRQKYTDLASLSSEIIMGEVIDNTTESQTAHVWIGLRFMAGHWFWVSGDSFRYKAWSVEGEPKCPAENRRCGALDRDEKVWKPTDCEEKLNFFCIKKP